VGKHTRPIHIEWIVFSGRRMSLPSSSPSALVLSSSSSDCDKEYFWDMSPFSAAPDIVLPDELFLCTGTDMPLPSALLLIRVALQEVQSYMLHV
jgi:hypothetical protein